MDKINLLAIPNLENLFFFPATAAKYYKNAGKNVGGRHTGNSSRIHPKAVTYFVESSMRCSFSLPKSRQEIITEPTLETGR
jgi:hypothetical protein